VITREKALDTAIFLVANTAAIVLEPIERATWLVALKTEDIAVDLNEIVRGYKWKYREKS
jgi:hypothetical protein